MAATPQRNRGSIVSGSSIIAAGLASAVAAAVTSSVGWAGTLIGAAITTMIITAGSAILNAYLQSMKSRVQAAPGNIRAAAQRVRPQERGGSLPDNPRLRDNFVGRLRGALGWFSKLPTRQRRSILRRGLVGAVAAFIVGILVITAVEFGIGNSLSCGFWGNCAAGSAPGFGGGNAYLADGSGTGFSIFGGGSSGAAQQSPYEQPSQPGGGIFDGGGQQPAQPGGGGVFDGGGQQDGGSGEPLPEEPVQPEQPLPEEPAQPEQPLPEEPAQQ